VVDHDRTSQSRLLVEAFTASVYFRVEGSSDDPAALARALDRGDARVGMVIPPGFAADVRAGRSPAVQILVDGSNSNTATVAQGYAARIVQELGIRWASAAPTGGVDLRARARFNPGLVSRVYNVPAVIGVIVLLMSLLLTALAVVREREMGTLDQLLVSPLTPGELMLGKTLPVAGVALVQLALVTSVALLWFGVPLRGSVFVLLLAALLFVLSGLALGLLISAISATQQEAFLTMFLFLLPAIILSGFLYPVDPMPPFFQTLTLANPLRHFITVVRAAFLKGAGMAELWPEFLILGAMATGALVYATRRFRASLG
jgi:ABC-2 type transport system permease protein